MWNFIINDNRLAKTCLYDVLKISLLCMVLPFTRSLTFTFKAFIYAAVNLVDEKKKFLIVPRVITSYYDIQSG